MRYPRRMRFLFSLLLAGLLAGCVTQDKRHSMIVSVPEQRMLLLDEGRAVGVFPVSTSKFALSDRPGSKGTPLGRMKVAAKIGGGAPAGAVFKSRRRTGEVLAPDAPGRDPIVSRILWLQGTEARNRNAYGRYIYIHGTAEERTIGRPASFGCIRMKSRDVIALYSIVGVGAAIEVIDGPLPVIPLLNPPSGGE